MTRKNSQNKKNASNLSPQSDPQNGTQNPVNALEEAVELTAVPQNVRITAQIKPKSNSKPPANPTENRSNGRRDPEQESEEYDADDLPGIFRDVFGDYSGNDLQCTVSKYTNPERSRKKAYSCQFTFNPEKAETVLQQVQEAHPEGGTFKLKITNSDLSVDEEWDDIEILPTVQYRRPMPAQQQTPNPQPSFDPMAFMKPMIEMQTMAFGQMQMMMTASNAMMTGIMSQMEHMNKIRPEPPDPLAMVDKVVGMFSKVKEAQGSLGVTDAGAGSEGRGTPWTGMDILYNILDKPRVADRLVNIVEHAVGIPPNQTPQGETIDAEVIDDEEEPETTRGEIAAAPSQNPPKEPLTMQQEYDITFSRAISDWQQNLDPKPSGISVRRFLKKYSAQPQFQNFSVLFKLTPAQAFEAIKGKLLLPEMHDQIKALPHYLDWFTKFLEYAK
jgi:hypothetical protein